MLAASDAWMAVILACGTGLRTTLACAMPGMERLMVRSSVPVTRSRPSTMGMSGKESSATRRDERFEGAGDQHSDHLFAIPRRPARTFYRIYRIGVPVRDRAHRCIIETSSQCSAADVRPRNRSRSHRSHHHIQVLDGALPDDRASGHADAGTVF